LEQAAVMLEGEVIIRLIFLIQCSSQNYSDKKEGKIKGNFLSSGDRKRRSL